MNLEKNIDINGGIVMITVFTPTYNRKENLQRLYDSLLKQKTKFEWIIVDDGSKDNTNEFILKLKRENKIKINYFYKENGGKQSAYNKGLELAKGDIFLCIDSDDFLEDNILSTIEKDFKKIIDDDKVCAIMYNQGYISDKSLIGTCFPKDNLVDNYYNIYNKYNVSGDKLIVFKTNIAKKYPFPIIKGEKFITEALIYDRVALNYNFLCKNKIAAYKEYLNDGYSNNYFELVKRNPKGNALYYKELYHFNSSLHTVYGYLLFCFFAQYKFKQIIKHDSKLKVILLYIPVKMISIIRRR